MLRAARALQDRLSDVIIEEFSNNKISQHFLIRCYIVHKHYLDLFVFSQIKFIIECKVHDLKKMYITGAGAKIKNYI